MKCKGGIVTLTTDFGQKDSYVAEMKGVILTRNPKVRFIDISHEIPPQNRLYASLLLWRSFRYFPEGTIHLVVVDPEVGTRRGLLIGETKRYFFLAPDNGILSPILLENKKMKLYTIVPAKLPITSFSNTFHGRDVLAPCAALLSLGISPHKLGNPASSITHLSEWQVFCEAHRLEGKILSKDHFGNVITNIREKDYRRFKQQGRGKSVWIRSGRFVIRELCSTYAEGREGPIALFGSSGLLELALRNGNAFKTLPLRSGNLVWLTYGSD